MQLYPNDDHRLFIPVLAVGKDGGLLTELSRVANTAQPGIQQQDITSFMSSFSLQSTDNLIASLAK